MVSKKSNKIGIYDDCVNPYVFDRVPMDSICLDVGCWNGNLGEQLITQKNCTVDGLDFNVEALSVAQKKGYRNVFITDLVAEPNKLARIKNKYDCIICADVLEHTAQPDIVAENLAQKLRPGGIIIISVPNIVFVKNRLDFLLGKFEYNENGGIMDIGHLRFFTMKNIKEVYKKTKLKKELLVGYSLVKDKYFFLRLLAKYFPSLFAIQVLIILKKR